MTDAVVESHVAAGGAGAAGGVVLLAGAAKLWGHLTSDELSKGQVALMEHIKQCHAATILDSIRDTPPEFSTAEGVPALRMTSQRFAVEYWFDLIKRNTHTTGHAVVTTEVKDLISIICDYQSKRTYGVLIGGKEGDPINLMWEEFKNFLVLLAAVTHVTLSTIKSVQQRVHYIEVLGDEKYFDMKSIFGADSAKNNSLLTMERVRKDLIIRVLPVLQREYNTICVRNKLEQLINSCKTTIADLIKYGLHIYSDYDYQREFHFGTLSEGAAPYHATYVGRVCTALIQSTAVRRGFDGLTVEDTTPNLFLGCGRTIALHASVQPGRTPEGLPFWKAVQKLRDCGIHPRLQSEAALRPLFTFLGLAQEFAAFTGVWRIAKDLAGAGGDFMIYGPGLDYVYQLCPTFSNLVRDIALAMDAVNLFADDQYMSALQNSDRRTFRSNAQVCRKIRHELHTNLDQCVEASDDILSTAKKASSIVQESEVKWNSFISSSQGLLRRLQGHNVGAAQKTEALQLMNSSINMLSQHEGTLPAHNTAAGDEDTLLCSKGSPSQTALDGDTNARKTQSKACIVT